MPRDAFPYRFNCPCGAHRSAATLPKLAEAITGHAHQPPHNEPPAAPATPAAPHPEIPIRVTIDTTPNPDLTQTVRDEIRRQFHTLHQHLAALADTDQPQ